MMETHRQYEGFVFYQRRLTLGLNTREETAIEIGVSVEAVKSWETGKRPIPRYAKRALDRLEKTKSQQ